MSPDGGQPAALDHLALLGTLQDAFAASIADVDPGTPVPWCGGWRVRDLVVHLARIHHWAAAQAAGTVETPLGPGPFDPEPLYRRCATELRRTLHALGPDAVVGTLLGRGPARIWHRRQAHETLVHLWDLRTASGRAVDVGPEVWADTVDEVVTVMQPRQVRLDRMPRLPHPVDLVATDVGRRWRLDCSRDGPRVPAVVEVSGSASALALLLWRRVGAHGGDVTVTGDAAVLDAALALPLTP